MIVLGSGLTVSVLVWALLGGLQTKKSPLERLEQYISAQPQPTGRIRDELRAPFWERVVKPKLRGWEEVARKVTPAGYMQVVSRRLEYAGMDSARPSAFVVKQVGLAVMSGVGVFFFTVGEDAGRSLLLAAAVGGLAGMLPSLQLGSKGRQRSAQIARELPDVLDLLTVSVEAGLGFDSALAKVVEKMSGPLPDEFARILRGIRMGEPRRDALRQLAERTDVADLKLFIGSVVQGEQLGVSISKILRVQSDQIRLVRRQRAQEAAMKAPIKMLFPLVLFIFPALFVVLLGPAAIQIMKTFG